MNNSRRKWNIRQTKARKAAKEFYARINLLGSKTGKYDDSIKLHKAYELVDKRYKNDYV